MLCCVSCHSCDAICNNRPYNLFVELEKDEKGKGEKGVVRYCHYYFRVAVADTRSEVRRDRTQHQEYSRYLASAV